MKMKSLVLAILYRSEIAGRGHFTDHPTTLKSDWLVLDT